MLSQNVKSQLFEFITSQPFLGKYAEHDGILTFIGKIWDLKEMPSEDFRYKNAYEDAHQHIVNNNDWDIPFLFLERFKLLEGDEKYFIQFLEVVVNPIIRNSKDEILTYISAINKIIERHGFRMTLKDYFEELPVYRFTSISGENDLPIDIIENKIPIYPSASTIAIEYPSFKLSYDRWNDYSLVTMFDLTYRKDELTNIDLGKVKIMKRDTKSTFETLPSKFYTLANEYCSLGQSKNYYLQLKEILADKYYSFLLGLRDAAIFPKINEQFENDKIYTTSLIRENTVERLVRTIRYEIEGVNPNEYYKFHYTVQPPYSANTISLNFDFQYNTHFEHRIFALIGKNGTGKTRILSSLAKNLSEKEPTNFSPRKPVYGKVFSISYSFFDKFEIPTSDASFNYVYCGLKKDNNSWKTEDDLLSIFYTSSNIIREKNLENDWYEILSNFIFKDILDITFDKKEDDSKNTIHVFNERNFGEVRKVLSSGQSILLYMVTEILSQIRYDSLILFDEPETHLHPNAISALLNSLFLLVERFQSFCVIATHSPLIIQEIPARNIFVIERENNFASVRGLERESFGENLTVITQEIFGNREAPRHFVSLIEELIKKGNSYEEIISLLETDNLPVSSNVKLYIKSLSPH